MKSEVITIKCKHGGGIWTNFVTYDREKVGMIKIKNLAYLIHIEISLQFLIIVYAFQIVNFLMNFKKMGWYIIVYTF